MRDKTHVRLVDAHAEGNGGDHHQPLVPQKTILMLPSPFSLQPGVVGQGRDTLAGKPGRRFLDLLARQTIDNACIARMFFLDEAQ